MDLIKRNNLRKHQCKLVDFNFNKGNICYYFKILIKRNRLRKHQCKLADFNFKKVIVGQSLKGFESSTSKKLNR
ncbi:unnamed protein product [Trifolium pratense]|uniref:Uncharacterized protein n=1 Tax=Trifolium pratense TaxID=57577 RepID=A0ACB0L5V1_TRIPR|nr:unnamed protein product [Trifolium pratense]